MRMSQSWNALATENDALRDELRELAASPLDYGQETHGELHADALTHTKRCDELLTLAAAVTAAYTAEAEDRNDGEFALWAAEDLVNAIVALRAGLSAEAEHRPTSKCTCGAVYTTGGTHEFDCVTWLTGDKE